MSESDHNPPCWHKQINADGFCLDCGVRAAIYLYNASEPKYWDPVYEEWTDKPRQHLPHPFDDKGATK